MQSNASARAASRIRQVLRPILSVLSDENKLSIAEVSQTSPARLIEQVKPCASSTRWKGSLDYRDPRSE